MWRGRACAQAVPVAGGTPAFRQPGAPSRKPTFVPSGRSAGGMFRGLAGVAPTGARSRLCHGGFSVGSADGAERAVAVPPAGGAARKHTSLQRVRIVPSSGLAYTARMFQPFRTVLQKRGQALRGVLVRTAAVGAACVTLGSSAPLRAEEPLPATTPSAPAPASPSAAPAAPSSGTAPAPEGSGLTGTPTLLVTPLAPPKQADPVEENPDAGVWVPSLFGDPTPYSRRPPTNRTLSIEGDIKYALVGTGPTRFVNDLRFSPWRFIEFRTQLGPVILPESLMVRANAGMWRTFGRFGVETGFHKLDLGLRLFPEEGQDRGFNPNIIPSTNLVANFTYDVPIWTRLALHMALRTQQRVQQSFQGVRDGKFSNPLDQLSYQLSVQGTFDVTPSMALTVGAAWGQALDNMVLQNVGQRAIQGTLPWQDPALPRINLEKARKRGDPLSVFDTQGQCAEGRTRTIFIDYVETARPGYATLVDRDNNCSLSVSGALTYGRTESFDVDLFGALRAWPTVGGLFGAGVRWRLAP
jgi:hypothetical protein